MCHLIIQTEREEEKGGDILGCEPTHESVRHFSWLRFILVSLRCANFCSVPLCHKFNKSTSFSLMFYISKTHHDSNEDTQAVLFLHFAEKHMVSCLQLFISSVKVGIIVSKQNCVSQCSGVSEDSIIFTKGQTSLWFLKMTALNQHPSNPL